MGEEFEFLFGDIPEFKNWKEIFRINKGWSSDEKFYVKNIYDEKLLIRLNDINEYEIKKLEFNAIKLIYSADINMSKPIDFGICCDNKKVYMILSWIEGESAEDALPKLSENEQYKLGVEAGAILKRIHSVPIETVKIDAEIAFKKKFETKKIKYESCPVKIPNDKSFLEFIYENTKYLKNMKQTIRHGDYHVGNLIITEDTRVGVIDFNRFDYGDPWKEFNRLMTFSRKVSIPFAKGQINGYFNNKVEDLFFRVAAVYTAYDSLMGIVSVLPFGEEDIKTAITFSKMIFDDYNGFESYIPKWYKQI